LILKRFWGLLGRKWGNSSHAPLIVGMHMPPTFSLTSTHNPDLGTTHHNILQMSWSYLELPILESWSTFFSSLQSTPHNFVHQKGLSFWVSCVMGLTILENPSR